MPRWSSCLLASTTRRRGSRSELIRRPTSFARLKGREPDRLKYQANGQTSVDANDSELRITFKPKEGKAEDLEVQGARFRMGAKRVE